MVINKEKLDKYMDSVETALKGMNIYKSGHALAVFRYLKVSLPKESGLGLMTDEQRKLKLLTDTTGIPLDIYENE